MMSLAVFLLSAMDLALKQLVEHYPSMQVVFLRCITSAPSTPNGLEFHTGFSVRLKYMMTDSKTGLLLPVGCREYCLQASCIRKESL
jgi:hypothetical protein